MRSQAIIVGAALILLGIISLYHFDPVVESGDRAPASWNWRWSWKHWHMDKPKEEIPDVPDVLTVPPTESLHCVFEAEGFANSTIDYDPTAMTVTTTTGSPPAQQTFTSVTVRQGLAPYLNSGFSVIAFGDVPLFHVTLQSTNGAFPATWGLAVGGPQGVLNAGLCTTVGGDDDGDGDHECMKPHHHHMHRHKHKRHKKFKRSVRTWGDSF